jgi:hypothetical protein
MTLILDTSALLALERDHRAMSRRYEAAKLAGMMPLCARRTPGPVRREPLAITGTCDVVNAALVLLATDGDLITTSGTGEIATLAEAAGVHVEIVPV